MKENAAVLRPCGGPFPETASWSSRLEGNDRALLARSPPRDDLAERRKSSVCPPIYPPCAPAAHKRLRCFPTMYLRRCGRIPPALPPYLYAELTLRLARMVYP